MPSELLRVSRARLTTDDRVFFDRPWDEQAFLGLIPDGTNRGKWITAQQRYLTSDARFLFALPIDPVSVQVDARLQSESLTRAEKTSRARLWVGSGRLLIASNLGGGWSLVDELTSRAEVGEASISPYRYEPSTFESESFRSPNVLQAYIAWRGEWMTLAFGRQTIRWGPGIRGALLLSDTSGVKPMVRLAAEFGWLRFVQVNALLAGPRDTEKPYRTVPKFLAAHRLEVIPLRWLNLAVSESVVYSQDFDVKYLNPVDVYFLDDNLSPQNNRNVSLETSLVPWQGFEIYGELFVDDFQPQEGKKAFKRWNTKGGVLGGMMWVDPLAFRDLDVSFEYAFVNQFAYTHGTAETRYTDGDVVLGHVIGTDAESLWIRAVRYWSPRLRTALVWERQRHGEGDVTKKHPAQTPLEAHVEEAPLEWTYLSGTVEETRRLAVTAEYSIAGTWHVRSTVTRASVRNLGNRWGDKASFTEGRLALEYDF
jgi:hypothetical protein